MAVSKSEVKRLAAQLDGKQVDEKIKALEEQADVVADKLETMQAVRKLKQEQADKANGA